MAVSARAGVTVVCQSAHTERCCAYRRRMAPGPPSSAPSRGLAALLGGTVGALVAATVGIAIVGAVLLAGAGAGACENGAAAQTTGPRIALGAPGTGRRVGATEYGGPGDRTSGSVGAAGVSLLAHPDSYAELGGATFQTATAMGGLAYLTPLRITWAAHSAIAYKRDIGIGGGAIDGRPRVIDLWWELAGALRIPYERGLWSGTVTVARPPAAGAGAALGQEPAASLASGLAVGATGAPPCGPALGVAPLPIISGSRAQLLAGGQAAAPAGAPAGVRGMIAAGNAIAGRPYVYGAGHGLPLDQLSPAYDCSSSVEHLLYGGGLLAAGYGAPSSSLMTWGRPGPGRWVTLYASPDHVFMYVAGLRWDTWNAAGPGDGAGGIGWHPLIRDATGFVARHPVGL